MTHHDLKLYKKSIEYVTRIYRLTSTFPSEEKFGIISQLRRSAVSVPTNIAEGAARKSNKELAHFLYISLGSISEIETLLIISSNLGYIKSDEDQDMLSSLTDLKKMNLSLIKSISNPSNS